MAEEGTTSHLLSRWRPAKVEITEAQHHERAREEGEAPEEGSCFPWMP